MQAQLEAVQGASVLRQDFDQWMRELPWTMHVPLASMAHSQQPTVTDMLSIYIASDSERCQAHQLLQDFLAVQQPDWDALKCIRYYLSRHAVLRASNSFPKLVHFCFSHDDGPISLFTCCSF